MGLSASTVDAKKSSCGHDSLVPTGEVWFGDGKPGPVSGLPTMQLKCEQCGEIFNGSLKDGQMNVRKN